MCTKATQEYASTLTAYMREYANPSAPYIKYAARADLLARIEQYLISQFSVHNFVTLDAGVGYPGDDCCALFEHTNYTGRAVTVCRGPHSYMEFNMYDYDFPYVMSSYYCGKGINAYFFNGDARFTITAGNTRCPNLHEKNDALTRVILRDYDPRKRPAVTICSRKNCEGACWGHKAPVERGERAEYINRGWSSSLMIPAGAGVDLYGD